MAGTLLPPAWFEGHDDDGSVLSGGSLAVYIAGTTSLATVYADEGLTTPLTNPVVLDSSGRATFYVSSGTYKFVLSRADGSSVRTQDNIASTDLGITSTANDFWFFGGAAQTPITATDYPSGTGVNTLLAGSGIMYIDSADLVGTFCLEAMLLGDGASTVTVAIVDLDDGTPDTPLASCSSSSTTGARVRSSAIPFAAPGAAKNYGIKGKIASGAAGYAWGARLVKTA